MWTSKLIVPSLNRTVALASQAAVRGSTRISPQWRISSNSIRGYPTSSTSAITYKKRHPRLRHPVLTAEYLHPADPSAEEAVSNILYNTPPTGANVNKRHIFNCLVQNEPGVLSRVSGILAGRGFNIDSLVVAKTEVPVWAVLDYSDAKLVQRELLLVKVSILGPEHVRSQMKARSPNWELVQEEAEFDISPSDALRQTQSHLRSLTELAKLFNGKVVDVSSDCVVIELSAKPDRVNNFIKLVKPFGILEAARSGMMAMPRSPIFDEYEGSEEKEEEGSGVDASMLPPG
ncbi:hypothetical protein BGZ76_007737 [Entomortierella beljakovae]|nr:hypothetical protein BGZ76_007737 [Entomortierella beljakovae]